MANFKMTDLCDLSWCLAIQVTQGTDAVLLSQSIHVTKLLERFGIQDCKPIKTPTAINFKKELYSVGDLLDESDKQLYQSLVGSLMWAMIGTRPDITFAIVKLSKFVSKPSLLCCGKINLVKEYALGSWICTTFSYDYRRGQSVMHCH
jgi:hypothetical protein